MATAISSTTSANDYSYTKTDKGYAYNDEYGFAHVVKNIQTAQKYSGDGKVYNYEGKFGGGYALDNENNRASLPLPDTVAYGNDIKEGHKPNVSKGTFSLLEHVARMQGGTTPEIKSSENEEDIEETTKLADPTLTAYLDSLKTNDYMYQIENNLLSNDQNEDNDA